MKRGLMGEDPILYEKIKEITRPDKNSLAQGGPQDDTEVT
jgi:hypothetical protein